MTLEQWIALAWIASGIVGTLLRKDLLGDARVQSGLFPVFSWIGPMIGGIMLGPIALLSAFGLRQ